MARAPDTAAPGAPPIPEAGRHDAFISYAREDKAFVADVLTAALRRRGKNVWVDLTDIPPAADWRERIRRGIEASKTFVFVLSPDSARSPECADEVRQAVHLHKRVVPVLHRDVDPEELPPALRAPNWVPVEAGPQLERQLDTLVYALEADLEWRDAHARLAVRGREWQEADRDRGYLLRGRDLREARAWLADAEHHREAPTELQVEYVERSAQHAARRRRAGIAAALVTLATVAVLGLVALAGREEASRQSETARSNQLAAAARARVAADPELALLLAREAVRLRETPEAVGALRQVLARPLPRRAIELPSPASAPPVVAAGGGHVLQMSEDRVARIWELGTRRLVTALRPHDAVEPNYPGEVDFSAAASATLSPHGRLAATAGRDGVLRVWRWPAARPLAELDLGRPLNGVAISPDGRQVAAGTFTDERYTGEGEVVVVDWRSGRRVARLRAPVGPAGALNGQVLKVAFDASGRRVAAGLLTSTAFVWDVGSRAVVARLSGRAAVRDVSFSPAGSRLATADQQGVHVWDIGEQRRVATLRAGGRPASVSFTDDGDSLIVAGQDGKARLWDWRAPQVRVGVGGDAPLAGAALTGGTSIVTSDDKTIREWADLESPRVEVAGAEGDELTSVTFSRDGRLIVTGGIQHTAGTQAPERFARVWDAASLRPLATLGESPRPPGDSGFYYRVSISSDGRLVAGAGESGAAHVWDWRTGELRARLAPEPGPPGDLAFVDEARLALIAPGDLRVWRWDRPQQAQRLRPFHSSTRPVYLRLAWADRSGLLVAAAGDRLQAWTGPERERFAPTGVQPTIQEVDVTPDGRFVAAALERHGTRVWDRTTSRVVAELRDDVGFSADFSRDSALLATSDRGTGARVWDWARDETLLRLRTLRDSTDYWTWDVAFSPDGARVATVDRSGSFFVYDCRPCGSTAQLLREADRRASRALTASERRRFLGAS